jgi:sugar/nucleoside kinase (ribokinase family)
MATDKVLCYGGIAVEAFIDLPYLPKPGIAHIICDEAYRIGGGSANVAEWLGSWDIPTRLSGYAIGNDRQGDRLVEWLKGYSSIDLSHLERRQDIDTLVSRTIPFPDGNKYLLCIGYSHVTITLPTQELLKDISILEIAFYYRQERGNAASAQLARMAVESGIRIVAMDVLHPEDELVKSTGVIINSAASILEQYPGVDPLRHCQELHSKSKGIVILTNGSSLIHAIDRDDTLYSLMPPTVMAVDATGAGDSFRAGIIYGLINGWTLPQSLQWAAAVSAFQVQRGLAQDVPPSKEQILKLASNLEVNDNSNSLID